MTLAEQIAAAAAGKDTGSNGAVKKAESKSLQTKSSSGNL